MAAADPLLEPLLGGGGGGVNAESEVDLVPLPNIQDEIDYLRDNIFNFPLVDQSLRMRLHNALTHVANREVEYIQLQNLLAGQPDRPQAVPLLAADVGVLFLPLQQEMIDYVRTRMPNHQPLQETVDSLFRNWASEKVKYSELKKYKKDKIKQEKQIAERTPSILAAFLLVVFYFIVGFFITVNNSDSYQSMDPTKQNGNNRIIAICINALYFMVVIGYGVGYGDLYPIHNLGKVLTCFWVILAFFLLNSLVHILMEKLVSKLFGRCLLLEARKVSSILYAILISAIPIAIGMLGIFFTELDGNHQLRGNPITVLDLFYMSLITLTTVGFGDLSFKQART